jgi:hypothetical protein
MPFILIYKVMTRVCNLFVRYEESSQKVGVLGVFGVLRTPKTPNTPLN